MYPYVNQMTHKIDKAGMFHTCTRSTAEAISQFPRAELGHQSLSQATQMILVLEHHRLRACWAHCALQLMLIHSIGWSLSSFYPPPSPECGEVDEQKKVLWQSIRWMLVNTGHGVLCMGAQDRGCDSQPVVRGEEGLSVGGQGRREFKGK